MLLKNWDVRYRFFEVFYDNKLFWGWCIHTELTIPETCHMKYIQKTFLDTFQVIQIERFCSLRAASTVTAALRRKIGEGGKRGNLPKFTLSEAFLFLCKWLLINGMFLFMIMFSFLGEEMEREEKMNELLDI